MLDEVIKLIKLEENRDADGYDEPLPVPREIFADVESPFRKEFYEAMKAGIKIELTFKVVTDDYQGQEQVEYAGKLFRIVRSYPIDLIYSRLVCEEVI